jgi:hypothetical protein
MAVRPTSASTRFILQPPVEPSSQTVWDLLPDEMQDAILTKVANPTVTAFVSRDFRRNSDHFYTVILREYQDQPLLIGVLKPGDDHLVPAKKVQKVFIIVIREAKKCKVGLHAIDNEQPLAPTPLLQIRERTLVIIRDKVLFFRRVFNALSPRLAEPFNQMTDYEIIEYSERRMMTYPDLFISLRGALNLQHLRLTHVPPQIQYLKNVTRIHLDHNKLTVLPPEMKSLPHLLSVSLRGNPLLPESVLEFFKTIPGPKTVVIDTEQTALVRMFRKEALPHLNVIVTEIIREVDILI